LIFLIYTIFSIYFREGALKLKTTGFLQAEAFSSGEMKHGPIALINPDLEGDTKGFFEF